ncbi:MAG: hypothetical protein M1401_01245 [Chloroflexi bacterium]|nr:hypothetical protein [Chloroflexota bacterium]MCL5107503.1 hypothetical protein [Chloroflexota bacterium]
MLYSQMSPAQRQALFDQPENYPFRVSFLGKVGILSQAELDLLRQNGVDFDVDDSQAAEVLGAGPVAVAAAAREPVATAALIGGAAAWTALRSLAVAAWRQLRRG